MEMPEYYLTRCEYEILKRNKDNLLRLFKNDADLFNLVELGAGDGRKTEILLKYFSEQNTGFIYTPIDVSETVLKTLAARLLKSIPSLDIRPINNRYDDALIKLEHDELSKVFLFFGATIGNFAPASAIHFARQVSAVMRDHDQFLIGFDLKKDPRLIQAAYDDPHGKTRDFNMNLLVRLNGEVGADFKLDNFSHYACYNPETGQNRSYLVSKIAQDVYIKSAEKSFHFDQWEVIHTEISQKYDKEMIVKLASEAGLRIVQYFFDSKNYFCDVLLRKTGAKD
jgi:dimethylhistidine N-methyltransferase